MASLGIISVNAQTLDVLSCTIQVSENIAESRPRYDLNDMPAAVVIFPETGDRQMEFRGNVIGETIKDGDRHIVYLADRTKRLHIYCAGFIPMEIDFTDYADSQRGLVGGSTYCISFAATSPAKKDYGTGSNVLIFDADVPLSKVIVNGETWPVSGQTAKRLVPFGEYSYEVYADSYETIEGKTEVVNTFGNQVVKLEFKKNSK